MNKWKKLESEIILDSKFFKVRRDIVELPNNERKEWIYWDSPDSAMLIGMTNEKKLVMIKQYRYMVNDTVIEFPSGGVNMSESIESGAKREFEEETGYVCDKLIKLGAFYETYGQLNRKIHFFFANSIHKTRQKLDRGNKGYENIEVTLVDYHHAVDLALQNKIVAMGSGLAILMLKEKIDRKEITL
ncbi:NUDIX hydrolase [Patescibacteria group bacterium]|nr:NUDIX hydrolase [Patescibacteria group bacterium]MBU1890738.1 NUDIX hydrolase [Patescibacteria group bacterium]